jgi:hypothetical protein
MSDLCELRGIRLPRTPVNKGKRKGRSVEISGPRLWLLALGYYFTNVKLATCVEPSLSLTTSCLHVSAHPLLVFHT